MVGTYRLIPKGSKIFSIHNQQNLIITQDTIVEITNTMYNSETWFFGRPQQELTMGMLPLGQDEWGFNLNDTTEYEYKPILYLDWSYKNEKEL